MLKTKKTLEIIEKKKKLLEARKNIKQKLKMMQGEKIESSKMLESRFQPIVEPLKALVKNIKQPAIKTEPIVKKEEEDIEKNEDYKEVVPTPPQFLETPTVATNIPSGSELSLDIIKKMYGTDETLRKSIERYISKFGSEIQYYIRDLLIDKIGVYDHTYGMRHEDGAWKIGDSNVEISNNDLIINNITYKGTPGLFELIFLKLPNLRMVTEDDFIKYKNILLATNAHKQKYLPRGRINANRGHKYQNVISKLFPIEHKLIQKEDITSKEDTVKTLTPILRRNRPISRRRILSHEGSGLKKELSTSDEDETDFEWKYAVNNKKFKYIFWNEVNELVNRLRVLLAEKNSGNNSKEIHNEIYSIVEELREEKIIK